jgi:hypothetical protein
MTMTRWHDDDHAADEPTDDAAGRRWRLAVHETGHALVYVVHGGRVSLMEAQPWVQSGGFNGSCEGKLAADILAKGGSTRHMHGALAALAGRVAERVFFRSIDDSGCKGDLQDFAAHVQRLEAVWHTRAPLATWEKAIEEMLYPMIAAHESVIAYVARVLADQRSMGEVRAMELFGLARKLWGIQPGPLMTPSWQVQLEVALARHRDRLP